MKASRRKLLIGAALFTLVAVSMMSSVSAISKKDAIVNFLNGCYNPTGVFGYYGTNDNSTSKEPTLESTFAAFFTLRLLGQAFTNTFGVTQFLEDLSNASHGGFQNIAASQDEKSVLNTFNGLNIRSTLNINTSKAEMSKHVEFLLDSQNEYGGFGSSPSTNSSPNIFDTYFALRALSITGNLTLVNMTKVHNFTMTCRESGNVFAGTSNSTDVSIAATYFAVCLFLEFMPSETDLDGTGSNVRSFLASNLATSGGFIDPASDTEPTLSSTYYAVSLCQDFAGVIPGGNEKAINWILSKQGYDGGFAMGSSPVASSSAVATYYAVNAIYKIRGSLSDLNVDTAWTLTQIAGIVAAVVLIIVIAVLLIVVYYMRKRNRI